MIHGIAAAILNFGGFAAVVILLIGRFTRHRSYRRIILEAWLGVFIWAIFNCLFFPLLFVALGYKDAFKYFPDTPGVVAAGLVGWIFGLQLAVAIFFGRKTWNFITGLVRRFTKRA